MNDDLNDGQSATEQPDRYAALEARLANLQNTLQTFEQRETVRQQQTQLVQQHSTMEQKVSEADAAVQTAQQKLAAAYETGEAAAIAAATAALSSATADRTAARIRRDEFVAELQAARQRPTTQAQPTQRQDAIDDSNLRQWRQRNEAWYGIDPEMTTAALEIDRAIRAERVLEVGSAAYFKAIDARLRSRFPDRMPGPTQAAAQFSQQRTPAATHGGAQETRIPAALAESYERMGFDMNNPDVVKKLAAARQVMVSKGILPEKPVIGRIVER